MFNYINHKANGLLYNLFQHKHNNNIINLAAVRAKLQKNNYTSPEITSGVIELFQKDLDINRFTRIAISDRNNTSHNERMQEVFKEGVIDTFEDNILSNLATNQKLWNDIGL